MSSLNDSVVIVTYDCYVCHRSCDLLIDNSCPHCKSRVIEKTSGQTPQNENKMSDQSAENVVNKSIKMCCICLDPLADAIKALKCGHNFHKQCIKGWFATKHNTCPMCRQKVVSPGPPLSLSNILVTHSSNT